MPNQKSFIESTRTILIIAITLNGSVTTNSILNVGTMCSSDNLYRNLLGGDKSMCIRIVKTYCVNTPHMDYKSCVWVRSSITCENKILHC